MFLKAREVLLMLSLPLWASFLISAQSSKTTAHRPSTQGPAWKPVLGLKGAFWKGTATKITDLSGNEYDGCTVAVHVPPGPATRKYAVGIKSTLDDGLRFRGVNYDIAYAYFEASSDPKNQEKLYKPCNIVMGVELIMDKRPEWTNADDGPIKPFDTHGNWQPAGDPIAMAETKETGPETAQSLAELQYTVKRYDFLSLGPDNKYLTGHVCMMYQQWHVPSGTCILYKRDTVHWAKWDGTDVGFELRGDQYTDVGDHCGYVGTYSRRILDSGQMSGGGELKLGLPLEFGEDPAIMQADSSGLSNGPNAGQHYIENYDCVRVSYISVSDRYDETANTQ